MRREKEEAQLSAEQAQLSVKQAERELEELKESQGKVCPYKHGKLCDDLLIAL